MTEFQSAFLAIIQAAFEPDVKPVVPDGFDWEKALDMGCSHQINPVLYYGIVNGKVDAPEPIVQRLKRETMAAVYKQMRQNTAIDHLLHAFRKKGIDHMPLKGTVIRDLYPSAEMRLMMDADILIREDQYETIKTIMIELGYEEGKTTDHEYIWTKPGALYLELHHCLVAPKNKVFYRYYKNGWDVAQRNSQFPSLYELKDEDLLVYLVVHLAKHYRASGIGIRHLLDIWVYLCKKTELDQERLHEILTEIQLAEFYNNLLSTLRVWFRQEQSTEITELITERIFLSGSMGTENMLLESDAARMLRKQGQLKHSRWIWLKNNIFPPYSAMCTKYPVLKRAAVLLPFAWAVRLFDIMLFHRQKIRKAFSSLEVLSPEHMEIAQKERYAVGLRFAFEEE